MVLAQSEWPAVDVLETDSALSVSTPALSLRIQKETLAFTWSDSSGNTLVREPDKGGKLLKNVPVEKFVFDETAEVVHVGSADGVKQILKGGKRQFLYQQNMRWPCLFSFPAKATVSSLMRNRCARLTTPSRAGSSGPTPWHSWPDGLWGEKRFCPVRFPDPQYLTDSLHAMNTRLMISIWPSMREGGTNYREMKERGFLYHDDRTYDAFHPDAHALYWEHAERGLFSYGIDAWWCDCTEPFQFDWNGSVKPEAWQRVSINAEETKKYIDAEQINAYSFFHSKGIYEGQRRTTDEKRVVNLTRSGFTGQHRYGTITWSGDTEATWERFLMQIADGLNFTVTGSPWWTLDIGSFFVKPAVQWFRDADYPDGVDDLGYCELHTRWFQYGAFLPMFRSHGTDTPREIWRFGGEESIFYRTLKKYDELRYRLLPYIYATAAREVIERYTMYRMLAFDFLHDTKALTVRDQFMFGPAFLVCPVVRPMYYGPNSKKLDTTSKTRSVYLPEGSEWYDFWTNNTYSGGQTIEADAPLETIPLYVRAGSIVPMCRGLQHSGALEGATLEIHVYPGRSGTFSLYEDEGDGYNYEQGCFSTSGLDWNDQNRTLTIGERRGSFPGMTEVRDFKVAVVGRSSENRTITYRGAKKELEL